MSEEVFEVVDGTGKVVGREKRSVVHRKGILHRAVEIIVQDKEGKIFIQKRASGKDVSPGLWDFSAAEHLKPGESFKEAAARGVKEELGVEPTGLEKLGETRLHLKQGNTEDNELKEVFKSGFEGKISLQKEEVSNGKWVSKEELLKEMGEKPERFTPWMLEDKKFLESL